MASVRFGRPLSRTIRTASAGRTPRRPRPTPSGGHREGDKHRDSPARLVMCRSDMWLQGWEPVPGEPRKRRQAGPAAAAALESAGIFVIRRRACTDVPKSSTNDLRRDGQLCPGVVAGPPVGSAGACARNSGGGRVVGGSSRGLGPAHLPSGGRVAISDEKLGDFLDRLAGPRAGPGRGCRCGPARRAGAALLGMVARYTTGEKYAKHQETIGRIIAEVDELRGIALRLADAERRRIHGRDRGLRTPQVGLRRRRPPAPRSSPGSGRRGLAAGPVISIAGDGGGSRSGAGGDRQP